MYIDMLILSERINSCTRYLTLPGSCSTGIAVLLEKLGVPYQLIKRNDIADYQEIVPTNQVPALKTENGRIITEGAVEI